ncbi:unnamed protein product [Cylicostephanus goldi]|uniref:Uncharacterized protein n=1 Tax=Cylicostephanus goldi TaxID=71465 RepID=A0A3P7MSB9_CYLGO|nr:unnamed protein product [Cylicostephanus goldi]
MLFKFWVIKVLTKSAKILGEKKTEIESERKKSTVKEPVGPDAATKSSQDAKQEQSLQEVQKMKGKMPFNSSVFSIRKNRSLPDLQSLAAHATGYHSDGEAKPPSTSLDDLDTPKAPVQRRKKSRVSFQPISIKVDTESDSEGSSSMSSSPTHSILDAHDVDHIADGALSDSEVDRHRNTIDPHANDVTDWKWGQIPETRENKLKQEQAKAAEKPKGESSGWTWFPWGHRSSPAPAAQPAEEGISLDELFSPDAASDPSKIQKYLGKTNSTAVSIDSGHASRGPSQPSSPSVGMEEPNLADKTPTQETAIATAIEHENERTRNVSDGRSAVSSEDIFPLSEDEIEDVKEKDAELRPAYMLSLRLSSEKLKALGLVYGANECRFSITTKFQVCGLYYLVSLLFLRIILGNLMV